MRHKRKIIKKKQGRNDNGEVESKFMEGKNSDKITLIMVERELLREILRGRGKKKGRRDKSVCVRDCSCVSGYVHEVRVYTYIYF